MNHTRHSLEPDHDEMTQMGRLVLERTIDFVDRLPDRPAHGVTEPTATRLARDLLAPPPDDPQDLSALLDRMDQAAAQALESAGPGYLGLIPAGGLYTSALADLYKSAVNRYSSLASLAPVLTALEESIVRWIARDVVGLPATSGGLLTSGGSLANFSAVIAARDSLLGDDLARGTVYLSEQSHHSAAKGARLAGISPSRIRVIPSTAALQMNVHAASAMIEEDRRAGLRPFMLIGCGGTTDTGAIDPLPELARLAGLEGLWLHVDAAYGGFFALTDRGRARLAGIERADSVTLDPHKSLFLPSGIGAIVVRDRASLAGERMSGHYLQDSDTASPGDLLPDYGHLGPELTRDVKGLKAWLPLHLHGVDAFRDALNEKLDLTGMAYEKLRSIPGLELPWRPELTVIPFRARPRDGTALAAQVADQETRLLLREINANGRVFLSSTVIGNRQTIRMAILSHRTHEDRVAEALDIIAEAAGRIVTAPRVIPVDQWPYTAAERLLERIR
jgi:aromatic-L-amino-acid decarboxylase